MKCLLRWLAVVVFSTSLIACAKPLLNLGPFSYTIPQAQLQQAIAKRFPYRQSLGDLLELQVQDDGLGFDHAGQLGPHLGLVGMRERAFSVGAELHIDGRPGHGTIATLTWMPGDEPHLPD